LVRSHSFTWGLPIGGNLRRLLFWESVVNRIKTRLSYWQSRFLSFGCHLVLLKSVLTALPVYALFFFKAPSGIPARYLSTVALLNSRRVTAFVQNPLVNTPSTIFFPSTLKNPKSAKFWVKIFIPNHCKSSGNKFLRSSSIKYQVMYHLNSSHFAGFRRTLGLSAS